MPEVILAQRYRAFHAWKLEAPAQVNFVAEAISESGEEITVPGSVLIRSFCGHEEPSGINSYWSSIQTPGAFRYGNGLVVEPKEPWPMQVNYASGTEGQIDILVGFSPEITLDHDELRQRYGYLTYATAFLAHTMLDDMVVPEGEPRISWGWKSDTVRTKPISAATVYHRDRINVDDRQCHVVLKEVAAVKLRNLITPRVLELGLRRYLNVGQEADVIDTFCDLWECLEFLSPKHPSIRGGIESRIAHHLSIHTGRPKGGLQRDWVAPLYRIRKDIVHEAQEDEDVVRRLLHRLVALSRALIRYHLGLPFDGDPQLGPTSAPREMWLELVTEVKRGGHASNS